ncbi:MAG: hypothetical protein GPOALKHO_001816 [Sodalis sp.]|nr:MAG: hypothetical protein GPOALKHO_001816 [Sodalis sp.]
MHYWSGYALPNMRKIPRTIVGRTAAMGRDRQFAVHEAENHIIR